MAATRSSDDVLRVDGHEFQPLPQSWAAHGRHVDREKTGGHSRVYAVSVAIDEGRESLFVRYVHPVNPDAFVREFEAVRNDGSWLPLCYTRDGPRSFPVSLCVQYFAKSDHVVRKDERDRLWNLYQEQLADTAYTPEGWP